MIISKFLRLLNFRREIENLRETRKNPASDKRENQNKFCEFFYHFISVDNLIGVGVDMVCEGDIMGLIHHEKDPYGVLSPSGAFSFWDSSKLER